MILDRMRADVSWGPLDDRWYMADPSLPGVNIAGFPVTADSAARVSTVFACVGLRADTLATLPCHLYRRLDNGGKERAKDHRWYAPLRRRPNAWMTAADFFGFGEWHTSMVGGVIAEIREVRKTVELIPHHPALVDVEQLATGRMRYVIRDPNGGKPRTLSQDEVLHNRDLTINGTVGLSRLALAKEAIAVAAAGEAFVGGFFKHDATGRLVISHKGNPPASKEIREQQREEFARDYAGWANRSKTLRLYNEATITEVGRELDGNFIVDPRKFQVSDVARFWRCPGFMIGLEEKSTSWGSGLTEQKQGWVDFTVRAIATRWEQAMNRDLLEEDEQDEFFFEFLFDDLLRGDIASTVEALAVERANGALNPNEWRIIRNRNPRSDPGGEEYLDTPAGAGPNPQPGKAQPAEDDDDEPVPKRERADVVPPALVADAAARIVGAELRGVGERAPKAPGAFLGWAHGFFAEQRAFTSKVLAPMAEAFAFDAGVVEQLVDRVHQTALAGLSVEGVRAGWTEARREAVAQMISEILRDAETRRAA